MEMHRDLPAGSLSGIFQKRFMIMRKHCVRLAFQYVLCIFCFYLLISLESGLYTSPKLLQCAESALQSVVEDLSHTYFVGNAPMGHMVMQQEDDAPNSGFKRFFFKSQVIATNKFRIGKCQDFVWITKDELLEYFPKQAEYLNKMIIS